MLMSWENLFNGLLFDTNVLHSVPFFTMLSHYMPSPYAYNPKLSWVIKGSAATMSFSFSFDCTTNDLRVEILETDFLVELLAPLFASFQVQIIWL